MRPRPAQSCPGPSPHLTQRAGRVPSGPGDRPWAWALARHGCSSRQGRQAKGLEGCGPSWPVGLGQGPRPGASPEGGDSGCHGRRPIAHVAPPVCQAPQEVPGAAAKKLEARAAPTWSPTPGSGEEGAWGLRPRWWSRQLPAPQRPTRCRPVRCRPGGRTRSGHSGLLLRPRGAPRSHPQLPRCPGRCCQAAWPLRPGCLLVAGGPRRPRPLAPASHCRMLRPHPRPEWAQAC